MGAAALFMLNDLTKAQQQVQQHRVSVRILVRSIRDDGERASLIDRIHTYPAVPRIGDHITVRELGVLKVTGTEFQSDRVFVDCEDIVVDDDEIMGNLEAIQEWGWYVRNLEYLRIEARAKAKSEAT